MVTNMKNTVYNFKRLLGRKYNDPLAQRELQSLPFKTSPLPDGNIGIHVSIQTLSNERKLIDLIAYGLTFSG